MSLPTNLGAYTDCLDYFDKAIADPKGIRIQFADYSEAKYFSLRMSNARVLVRDEAKRLYQRDEPLWGRSEYDGLQVKSPAQDTDGHWWVYIIPHNSRVLTVESLSDEA